MSVTAAALHHVHVASQLDRRRGQIARGGLARLRLPHHANRLVHWLAPTITLGSLIQRMSSSVSNRGYLSAAPSLFLELHNGLVHVAAKPCIEKFTRLLGKKDYAHCLNTLLGVHVDCPRASDGRKTISERPP